MREAANMLEISCLSVQNIPSDQSNADKTATSFLSCLLGETQNENHISTA